MRTIIPSKRSVIVAADVSSIRDLSNLAEAVMDVPGIGGFKIGFTLAMRDLALAVRTVKHYMGPRFPVIYDHQKAGTDIPEMGPPFAELLKESGVDAAILYPFAGPATQEAWTKACVDAGLQVITGGVMTHPQFLVREGGYIADDAVERIYQNACKFGCRHFAVPGNKIYWVKRVRYILELELAKGNFALYALGFITQGGDISECGQAAGDEWHAIVGSAIHTQPTRGKRRQAAIAVTSQITAALA